MTPEQKQQIDNMSYEQMLRKVRFAPIGDPFFLGGTELADYFAKRMSIKKAEVGQEGHVAASKRIGW